jgi:hypothetical protein
MLLLQKVYMDKVKRQNLCCYQICYAGFKKGSEKSSMPKTLTKGAKMKTQLKTVVFFAEVFFLGTRTYLRV